MLMYNHKGERNTNNFKDIIMYGSGSSGNSLYIKPYRIIIDLGLAYRNYDEDIFYNVKYILLTHEHGDHFYVTTIDRIHKKFPHITFVMSEHLYDVAFDIFKKKGRDFNDIKNIQILSKNEPLIYEIENDEYALIKHTMTDHGDIPNVSYTIKGFKPIDSIKEPVILYASDLISTEPTTRTEGLPKDEIYNLMFLEANYDATDVHEVLKHDPHDRKALGNLRHLSEDNAFNYVYRYLNKEHGYFIPLHASNEFGSFIQIRK